MDGPVLVTGHLGFLGRALVQGLEEEGIRWYGASRRSGIDLANANALAGMPDCAALVHLAGRNDVTESWSDPELFHRSNVLSTLAVAEYARQRKARVVFVSTNLYGAPQYIPVDERHPVACLNPYGWSKRSAELVLEEYAACFDVPVTVLRLFNCYGPRQSNKALIPHLVEQALAGGPIRVNDLTPRRDYVFVDDVVRVVLRAIARSASATFDVFNIGFGKSWSVAEVIRLLLDVVGQREVIERGDRRRSEVDDVVCDNRKASTALNWAPAVGLPEGLRRMVAAGTL